MIPFFRKIRKKIAAGNPAESGADDNRPLKSALGLTGGLKPIKQNE